MLVLQDVVEPTENVMDTENQVVAYWEKDCLGQGTLFLTECQMIWMDVRSGKGLRLPIPSIVVHAVSGTNEDFAEPCLFTMIDTAKAGVEYTPEPSDVDDDEEEEEDEVKTISFRLIPANNSRVAELFSTLNKCQELNPEPDEECFDDNMDEEDEGEENGEEEENHHNGHHDADMAEH